MINNRPNPDIPRGIEVARFRSAAQAREAISRLADQGFPVKELSLISEGLLMIEDVRGRGGLGRAFVSGVGNGMWLGLLMGLMFSLMNPRVALAQVLVGMIVIGGILVGLGRMAFFAMGGGRNSVMFRRRMTASSYVLVARSHSRQAIDLLSGSVPHNLADNSASDTKESEDSVGRFGRLFDHDKDKDRAQIPASSGANERKTSSQTDSDHVDSSASSSAAPNPLETEDGQPRYGVRLSKEEKDKRSGE